MTKYPFFSRVRTPSMIVLILLMSGPFCVGQEFSITFLFTDNVGNSDSIRVGFDSTANGEFNPQFGEIDLQAPFESTFEVRASIRLIYMRILSDQRRLFHQQNQCLDNTRQNWDRN